MNDEWDRDFDVSRFLKTLPAERKPGLAPEERERLRDGMVTPNDRDVFRRIEESAKAIRDDIEQKMRDHGPGRRGDWVAAKRRCLEKEADQLRALSERVQFREKTRFERLGSDGDSQQRGPRR